MLDILEWRHDWSKPRFTLGLIKHFLFGMIPEMIVHSKSQGTSISLLVTYIESSN